MAFFDAFRLPSSVPAPEYSGAGAISGLFTPSTLPLALFPDIDSSAMPVSADEALECPPIYRGVALFSSIISRLPLEGAPFLNRTDGLVYTPEFIISRIVQDLIFYAASVLAVTERNEAGDVAGVAHVQRHRWNTNDGKMHVDGQPVKDEDFIYISGVMPTGLLHAARATIRQYSSISSTVSARVATPNPVVLVKEDEETGATPDEIDTAMDHLEQALSNRRGGIVNVPKGLTVVPFGNQSEPDLYLEARNAVRTDVANFLSVNSAMLDGVQSGSSDVYTNALQSSAEMLEFSIKQFSEPIAARFNQSDVTPSGTPVKFDYSSFEPTILPAAGNLLSPRSDNPLNKELKEIADDFS